MSPRSSQVHWLASALGARYDVRFTARYDGGWRLEWADGPTEDEVRGAITRAAAQIPAVTDLHLDRAWTDLSEAVALLAWIDEDPARLADLTSWQIREAHGSTRYPMSLPDRWQARGHALLAAGYRAADGLVVLRQRDSWSAALEWLDELAARQLVSA
ncbi:hypothetical protein ACFYTF_29485 [Nocardia thailandica]|uniref:Uncharacterized protein n=1 Tax=Nocardia thailandica TaxID=257275 RepID=A0ABW6PXF7_9NOCA